MKSKSIARSKEMLNGFIQLSESDQQAVLGMIRALLKGKGKGSERVTVEQYNEEIDEALAQIHAGNFVTQDELEASSAKWKER